MSEDMSSDPAPWRQQSSQITGGSSPGTAIPGGSNGGSAPFPPPPPPIAPAGTIPSVRIPTEIGPAKKFTEPPAAIQNAMMTKDKKPFTYTPGGLDLAEIRSPRMARRINRNAHTEDSCTPPQPKPSPLAQQPQQPLPPAVVAAMQPQIAIPVFPPGAAPPGPSVPPPPPPPPPAPATTPSPGPQLPPPPPLPSPGVVPPPPPPMQDQLSPIKGPPQARPDFVSDIQKHPPLRQVTQAMPPRPDFVSEIPNHAPLRPVHFGARYVPQESPPPPISNQVQLKPTIPKALNIATTPQESPLSKPMANLQISHPPSSEADQAPVRQEQALGSNKIIQESHSPRYQPLYIPPAEVSSPTPMTPKQTPPSPATLNKSPAPWMNTQKQIQKEIPPWVSRENQIKEETQREEKMLREEKPSPAAAQAHTRIIPIQVEGTESSNQHVQKVQTQQKQSTVSVKQESSQAQSRTRIIPIQIEGANDNWQNHQVQRQASLPAQSRGPTFSPNRFNPSPAQFPNSPVPGDMGEGRPRQFQTQQSWTQGNNTPIQSRSFRVLQKITGSDEHPQGILPPGQAFLMNRVFPRQEEIPAHQYLGGDMSSRSSQNMPPGQDNSGRPGESEY